MAQTAADVLIDTIADWGVEVIFGLPGGTARSRRGVAHITFPLALQEQEADERSMRKVARHTADTCGRSIERPSDVSLRRAADVLNSGQRVAILAGRGALGAGAEL